MLMTKERELKEAVREGRDRVSVFDFSLSGFNASPFYFSWRLADLFFFKKKFSRLLLI